MRIKRRMLTLLLALLSACAFPLAVRAADTPPLPGPEAGTASTTSQEAEEPAYTCTLNEGTAVVTARDGASVTFHNVLAVHSAQAGSEQTEGSLLTLDILIGDSPYSSDAESLLIAPNNTDVFNMANASYALYQYNPQSHILGRATGEVVTKTELLKRGLRFGESQTEPGIGWRILPDTQGVLDAASGFIEDTYCVVVSNTHVLAVNAGAGPDYFTIRTVNSADTTLIADVQSVTDTTGGQWLQYSNGRWGFRLSEDMEGTLVGWKKIDGSWYYFDYIDTGKNQMATGWKDLNGDWSGRYWFDDSGAMAVGWRKIDGSWYYFNGAGQMTTGWQKVDEDWYYLEDGTENRGQMVTGWRHLDSGWGGWYYMEENGAMVTGWKKIDGKWYLFNHRGTMLAGWTTDQGNWYYLDPAAGGAMTVGWREINGKWRYFDTDGRMLSNQWVGTYWLDPDGVWTE